VTEAALVASQPAPEEELVRRLATDDEFRARLARSPVRALAEYQIELPPGAVPSQVVLPSRSQMVEALRALTGGHLAPARTSLPPRPKYWPAFRLAARPAAR
jgi:putative modified peptide